MQGKSGLLTAFSKSWFQNNRFWNQLISIANTKTLKGELQMKQGKEF
jgi:hypothetical protein